MSVCTIYGRLSQSLGDPADLDIYAHQIEPLKRLAAADGFVTGPGDLLCEVGTGEFIQARPTFRAWLDAVEALPGGIGGVVYVTELARLSRGTLQERGRIMDALVRAGIRIRTPSRWYDLSLPDDELLFAFLSSVGRHEQGRAKERIRRKFDQFCREGRPPTGKETYGYVWDKERKTFLPVEPAFSVVKALFADAPHLSTYALATKYGLPRGTIYGILRNPVYCGWPARHTRLVWRDGKRLATMLPRSEWTWPEQQGDYPAAVTRAEFERLQVILQARCDERQKPGSDGWCRDVLVFEGAAGEGRIELGSQTYQGAKYLVYELVRPDQPDLYIARQPVHDAAEEVVLAALSRPLTLLSAWERYREGRRAVAASDAVPASIRAALETERRTLARLALQEAEAGPEKARAIADAARTVEARIASLKRQLQESSRQQDPPPLTRFLAEAAGGIRERWAALPAAGKRELTRCLLAAVVVRCTPAPRHVPWKREVIRVEPAAWLTDE